jgi:hypothetical protein
MQTIGGATFFYARYATIRENALSLLQSGAPRLYYRPGQRGSNQNAGVRAMFRSQ